MPTPEDRTNALNNLAEALKDLVPLVQQQNAKLDQLVPREEVESKLKDSENATRRRSWIRTGLALTFVFFFLIPTMVGTIYAISSVKILRKATSPQAQQLQTDVIRSVVAEFDCTNEDNIQIFYNRLVEEGIAKPRIVFTEDNSCQAALQAALEQILKDQGQSPKVVAPSGGTSNTAVTRGTATSTSATTTTATSTPTPSTTPQTTTTTSPPPSTTTTTCAAVLVIRIC